VYVRFGIGTSSGLSEAQGFYPEDWRWRRRRSAVQSPQRFLTGFPSDSRSSLGELARRELPRRMGPAHSGHSVDRRHDLICRSRLPPDGSNGRSPSPGPTWDRVS
jgi:hypothetical protein